MTPQCGVRAAEDRAHRRDRIPYAVPKNPTRESWIFSFVPTGTTSFAVVRFANLAHATSFDRQVNIIAVCGTNERGCDKSQMMWAYAQ